MNQPTNQPIINVCRVNFLRRLRGIALRKLRVPILRRDQTRLLQLPFFPIRLVVPAGTFIGSDDLLFGVHSGVRPACDLRQKLHRRQQRGRRE